MTCGNGFPNGVVIRVLEVRACDGPGGGPEKTILAGAKQARKSAVTVCYIRHVSDTCGEVARRAEMLGVDYLEVRHRGPWDPRLYRQLRRIVRERKIDLVHSHEYKSNLLALMLAKAENVVPLSTAHGWTGNSLRERLLYYPADRRLLRYFPVVISVSSEITRMLIRARISPQRVRTLVNGIDAGSFERDPELRRWTRQSLGVNDEHILIGSVGRLERQKRFDLLIDAIAEVHARYPHVRLRVAGEGRLLPNLQRQVNDLGLNDVCGFVGQVSRIRDFYTALDVYVQSSDYEGTANVVLEAMAMQVPIVATDAGGTGDLVRPRQEGLLVPRGDERALAQAIGETIEQEQAASVRANAARDRVEDELSFARRCEQVEAIYLELGGAKSRCKSA